MMMTMMMKTNRIVKKRKNKNKKKKKRTRTKNLHLEKNQCVKQKKQRKILVY
jgi:hypothetical protein